jgi:hypothetical protein
MNKIEIIQKILTDQIKSRLDDLEKDYTHHSAKLVKSFSLIEEMKLLVSRIRIPEDLPTNYTSNNDFSKSFISSSSKNNFNKSKQLDKRQSSRGKTPFKSKTSVNMLEKSADKNLGRNRKTGSIVSNLPNFSKGKNLNSGGNVKSAVSNRTLTTTKSSSNLTVKSKGKNNVGTNDKDKGLSPDKLKRSKKLFLNFQLFFQ